MADLETQFNNKVEQYPGDDAAVGNKSETTVSVKAEPQECVVCTMRCPDCVDIHSHRTSGSGATVTHFLNKYTNVDLSTAATSSHVLCKGCLELINVLEQAEIEYYKLKATFEGILSKNPLFGGSFVRPIQLAQVKTEFYAEADDDEDFVYNDLDEDSDDEPLATQSKRKRQKSNKKKNVTNTGKKKGRKKANSTSWSCNECGMSDTVGGADALVAHKLAVHSIDNASEGVQLVKTENTEGSESIYNNGYNNMVEIELLGMDNDSLTDTEKPTKKPVGRPRKSLLNAIPNKKKPKVVHQCDQCDAKYTSLGRLQQHQAKHAGSKPPYICEVCGAHYKHKRACDIHIALHKGISDWKCEECNKLFPSKNALQRHNNIHTGKLNYQCDLCGKSFIHTSSFKMHKLSHSGVKPHACAVCGLALMTRSHLKRHARVHSGEKRHECQVCGKRFSERYNLVAHAKSHDTAPEVAAAQRRRLFRCLFCTDRFERRYMLERHMQVTHGRALERPPPTPRNTMSKLLKAQAQRRQTAPTEADTKEDVSSDSTPRPITAQKLIAQLSTSSIMSQGAWSATYPPDFNLRPDFPH